MKLATVQHDGAEIVVGKIGEQVRQLDGASSMLAVIARGRALAEAAWHAGRALDESALRFLAPIPQPGKMIAVGQNYMDHIREQNAKPPEKPLLFAKLNSSVNAPRGIIEWDADMTSAVDYEVELAVIIGRTTRLVTAESALDHVFGYTIANDVTARDLQRGDGQWTRAKGLDTFCPMGPWIVTTDDLPDPQHVPLRSLVNGEVRQDSDTSQMIFDIRTLIAHCSRAFTLQPGDVLLTGTPDGVGFYRKPPATLQDGDTVVCEIPAIGRLENLCRALRFRAG